MKDWWPRQRPVCGDCIGLPEERAIVQMAREDFHMVVVAVSAMGNCWASNDGPRVARVLNHMRQTWNHVPVLAFSPSSGAFLVTTELAPRQSATGDGPLLSGYISGVRAPKTKPPEKIPVVYITMDRDVPTERRARAAVKALLADGVPSKLICLPPLHVEHDFFTTRIGAEYSVNRSRAMVEALEQCGLLKDGFITENPLTYDWRPHLAPLALEDDSLVKDKSAISSCLNVAWAWHELSRDGVHEALTFLLDAVTTTAPP